MCGEKSFDNVSKIDVTGSPPRVRGKVNDGFAVYGIFRITPACAGKRYDTLKNMTLAKDHPRVCGEKVSSAVHNHFIRGSPPRVRGKGKFYKS